MVAMASPQLESVQVLVCHPEPLLWISSSEPQIKRHPTNLTLLVEAKAVLPCVTLGNPKPDVTWLKDDELIKVCALISALLKHGILFSAFRCCPQISDRVTILDYGALKIHNIQKEDAGQYRCVARNSFGLSISKPVSIEVQGTSSNISNWNNNHETWDLI